MQTCFLLRGTAQLIEELMTLQGFNESNESTIPLDPALPSARSTKPCKVTCASFDCAVSLASCDSRHSRQLAAPAHQTRNTRNYALSIDHSSSSFQPGNMRHKAMVGGGNLAFFESVSIEGIEGLRGESIHGTLGPAKNARLPTH